MLDTRQYDRSITDLYWNTDYVHDISNDAGRSVMGSRQENWFYNSLIQSNNRGAAWRIIGSQIVFSRLNESVALGNDNPLNYDVSSSQSSKSVLRHFECFNAHWKSSKCPSGLFDSCSDRRLGLGRLSGESQQDIPDAIQPQQ